MFFPLASVSALADPFCLKTWSIGSNNLKLVSKKCRSVKNIKFGIKGQCVMLLSFITFAHD